MEQLNSRRRTIRYTGIVGVARPWSLDQDDLDRLCDVAIKWSDRGGYDQKKFFNFIVRDRLMMLSSDNSIDPSSVNRVSGMLTSNDPELQALAIVAVKELLRIHKNLDL